MNQGRTIFAGGNTGKGFYSYHTHLLATGNRRTFLLKGGPGVGKSSFMKRVAKVMLEAGHDVELYYCSSDNESLDGVAVPALGIALMDATSPHLFDPSYPGAVDEIINLADYLDMPAVRRHKDEIKASSQICSRWFKRAYCYLIAAAKVSEDIEGVHADLVDKDGLRNMGYILEKNIFADGLIPLTESGKVRHFFGSAYTPHGYVDYTASILEGYENITYLDGRLGSGRNHLLSGLINRATQFGLSFDVYHTPLNPEKIQTLVFPELQVAVTTSDLFRQKHQLRIDLDQNMDLGRLEQLKQDLLDSYEQLNN